MPHGRDNSLQQCGCSWLSISLPVLYLHPCGLSYYYGRILDAIPRTTRLPHLCWLSHNVAGEPDLQFLSQHASYISMGVTTPVWGGSTFYLWIFKCLFSIRLGHMSSFFKFLNRPFDERMDSRLNTLVRA